MAYSIRIINEVARGKLLQLHADDLIEHLLLDSRRLIFPATSLFFALKGPRRDGGRFVGELYRRGVRNFVLPADVVLAADAGRGVMPEANIILVGDTLIALQEVAAWRCKQFFLSVVGDPGRQGKTTGKKWFTQLLENRYHFVC